MNRIISSIIYFLLRSHLLRTISSLLIFKTMVSTYSLTKSVSVATFPLIFSPSFDFTIGKKFQLAYVELLPFFSRSLMKISPFSKMSILFL